jgi:hypothetical protein
MTTRMERGLVHFVARRIVGRTLRRVGVLRLLPGGLVAMLVAEGLLLALRELRARPDLRRKLWRSLSART